MKVILKEKETISVLTIDRPKVLLFTQLKMIKEMLIQIISTNLIIQRTCWKSQV
jgi:hypothetical protein